MTEDLFTQLNAAALITRHGPKITITPGTEPLYSTAYEVCASWGMFALSMAAAHSPLELSNAPTHTGHISKKLGLVVCMPDMSAFLNAAREDEHGVLEIVFRPTDSVPRERLTTNYFFMSTERTGTLGETVVAGLYLSFYERHVQAIKSTYGIPSAGWPKVWRFGRVVRNAVAHGRLHEKKEKSSTAKWYAFQFGHHLNGRTLSQEGFGVPEFLILLIEMCLALEHTKIVTAAPH